MKKLFLATFITLSSLLAQVDGPIEIPYIPYEVKMGKHFIEVQANCLSCHSFGYIINQGPQSKEFWNGKVNKMIKHFKAPITKQDAKLITEYLFEHYGNGKLR